ncbi:MAG: hypothetical protein WKG32_06815 [Gemmatimonadaceae bacterium]
MVPFFPRETIEWRIEEPDVLRRLSLSLPAVAVLAGVLVRGYRLGMLAYAPLDNLWVLLGAVALGLVILLGLAAGHLGNYPVRHWLWRAPAFGVLEGAAAMAASAALVAAGVERVGTEPMHWHDWRADLLPTVRNHTLAVCAFALVLAFVVQTVRRLLLKRAHRDGTVAAVHDEHVRHST